MTELFGHKMDRSAEKGCDIKTWSGDCRHKDYTTRGDKYLCSTCGKILNLDHEVHHEIFPHITGDSDVLS